MTGRRIVLLVLMLLIGRASQAESPSFPLIIQASPNVNIKTITAIIGGKLLDGIPETGYYLINVSSLPSAVTAFLAGIQVFEPDEGITLQGFGRVGILNSPTTQPADWYKQQPSMQLIHSAEALAYSTGRGVVVADLNSRVDVRHPALIGHLTSGYDFVADKQAGSLLLNQSSASFLDQSSASFLDQSSASFLDQSTASFLDQSTASFLDALNPSYSHGTLCAGIIAAVAPDSMIMPLRVFDDRGSADVFSIVKAIHYAVRHGAQVINMSFGTLDDSRALRSAVEYALRNNVVVIASAGNNNTSKVQYPAAYDGVITTASTDLLDKKAAFSNYGDDVYVDAPGVNMFSVFPGGYYSIVSGTSFSAPTLAGTAALIRSLRATGVSADIARGAINVDSKNPAYAHQLGYGRIDILKAVKRD
jgi:subtilisin family serine protease